MTVQILRRCLQILTILVVTTIPLLSLYAHYRAARSIEDPDLMAGLRGEAVTRMIHPLVDALDEPQLFLDANKGTLWSMTLLGVDLTDPLAAAEMLAASKHLHWPLIVSILIPVAVTLILGKVFCSWMCPAYLLFEVAGKLRKLLRLAELQPGNLTFSMANKYVFLIAGLAIAGISSGPLFALIYPPAVVSRAIHGWVFGTTLVGLLVILGGIVAFEILVSPRWWCRTMCPGGALYGLIGWPRPVRVKLDDNKCTHCDECIEVCEAGLNPVTQSTSIECDNCGVCIRHCNDSALSFGLALPTPRRGKERSTKGLSKGAAAAVGLVLVAQLAWPSSAAGHHILGLPHYSYKENYPQRPTLEYPATTGPYDVLLTSYPGIPVPREPANLAFYIKNRDTSDVYKQPITVRILQTSTFGDNSIVTPPMTRQLLDNEFKFHVTFPEDGEFIVELSMMVEGREEIIPFLVVVGEPTATASLVVLGSLIAVGGFVFVRAWQIKKKRALKCSSADGSGRVKQGSANFV